MTDIYKPSEEQKERIRRLVKGFLQEQNTSVYKLAQMLEKTYGRSGSVSNLLNKLSRATFKISELMDIADLFGYEIKFVKASIEENSKKI
ncbi:LLM class flavin-dependent oxidoreductase [bacterium]|nr:LLM class flavin-dependent oxidoreductase [bacterium]MBR6098630.1 LLM class flavin-dependent oxidoreductase [bacterium]